MEAALQDLLTAFVLFSVGVLAYATYKRVDESVAVWKSIRTSMLPEALALVTVTIIVIVGLLYLLPFTKIGWLTLFFGSIGNIMFAPMHGAQANGSALAGQLFVTVFLLALMFIMPFMAISEEKSYRAGRHTKREILKQSVKFGFAHMLWAGVPLAAGIALIIPGLFYHWKYEKTFRANRHPAIRCNCSSYQASAEQNALLESATYHTLYNSILIALLLVLVWL